MAYNPPSPLNAPQTQTERVGEEKKEGGEGEGGGEGKGEKKKANG